MTEVVMKLQIAMNIHKVSREQMQALDGHLVIADRAS
jgi:hypothetical protein